jgi:hypothetical protein
MSNLIPFFKYRNPTAANRYVACIEFQGEVIHQILNPEEFYATLGYTQEMNKAGVLPEEFIWDEYIRDSTASSLARYQMQIIKYLEKHSDTFRNKFGNIYGAWLAELAGIRTEVRLANTGCA